MLISATARNWGPNYLQFGLELSNDFSGNSDFKIGAGYTRNALNSLGGEMRVIASMGREDELRFDFYQPVDLGANWFVNSQLGWKRQNYNLWLGDDALGRVRNLRLGRKTGVGRNFGTTHQLRLDYRYGGARTELITGTPIPEARRPDRYRRIVSELQARQPGQPVFSDFRHGPRPDLPLCRRPRLGPASIINRSAAPGPCRDPGARTPRHSTIRWVTVLMTARRWRVGINWEVLAGCPAWRPTNCPGATRHWLRWPCTAA